MPKASSGAQILQPVRPPQFFEFSGELIATYAAGALSPGWTFSGEHSWTYRAQNFVVSVSWLGAGESLEVRDVPDEYFLLVMDESAVDISVGASADISVNEASVVVMPGGASRVTATQGGFVVRVCSSRAEELVAAAHNHAAYAVADATLAGLPAPDRANRGVSVYPVSEIPKSTKRFGRIFRSESLMINWFAPQVGPRNTDELSPHSHDFEQGSITMAGEYVHHIRQPWTTRLRDWRADEHVHVHSPSVTIIPAGNIHTTRAIGDGVHHLIDVFAPPRQDFIDNGWVLNQSDYDSTERKTS